MKQPIIFNMESKETNRSEETDQSKETNGSLEKPGKLLGTGGYASVYYHSTGTVIKKYTDTENELDNYIEIIFLCSLKNPYVPTVLHAEAKHMILPYYGKTLDLVAENTCYIDRIRFIPKMLIQMSEFLQWMKIHNLVHMDIKPHNICLKDNKLTFIDWGFVGQVCYYSDKYYGTPNYADQSYVKNKKQISYAYDMFSCGLTVLSYLTKSHLPESYRDLDVEMKQKFRISEVYPNIAKELGENYVKIIKSMTDGNEKTRITAEQLYQQLHTDAVELSLPSYAYDNRTYMDIANKPELNIKMRNILIGWLGDVCYRQRKCYLMGYTTHLLLRLLSSHTGITRKTLQAYGIACYLISDMMLSIRTNRADDSNFGSYVTDRAFTEIEIKQTIRDILLHFKGNVYPQCSSADWNLPLNSKTGKQWIALFHWKEADQMNRVHEFLAMTDRQQVECLKLEG